MKLAIKQLIDNALKYSPSGTPITVHSFRGNGTVIIGITDHGKGISPQEQARIFERFYRVQNGSGKGGYGLGLFMVRHIVEAHGGRIEVESEPGRGSCFRLIFPVVKEWASTASS